MLISILTILLGAVLIMKGADLLTDGSSALAKRLNVSDMVIGLTVVAMGSSLPEFSVSFFSALKGSAGMSAGNIVGSNLFNTLVIVGVVAMISPLKVSRSTVFKDIPFTLVASLSLMFLLKDTVFGDSGTDILSRADGLVLLLFFGIFMAYTFSLALNGVHQDEETAPVAEMGNVKMLLYILIGFVCLIAGGEFFVDGASDLARILGVSETIIGLTILAAGTSLPELAASIMAARKGAAGMAIGNVVGSCLFNIFFILGVCSTVTPMQVTDVSMMQLGVLAGSGLLLWLVSYTHLEVKRWEGVLMTLCYIAFLVYTVVLAV